MLTRLIPELRLAGLRVSTIKHAHHGIVAVATDDPTLAGCPHPLLPVNDPAAIARWIIAFWAGAPAAA